MSGYAFGNSGGGSIRQDVAVASASADGDQQSLITDSSGALWVRKLTSPDYEDNTNNVAAVMVRPLASSTYSPSLFSNAGANATLNVKATAGNVFSIKCHNLNGATRYIQLHNTTTTPAGGAVPLWWGMVPANSEVIFGTDFFTQAGIHFDTGIAFAFSTTEATYTAGTASDQMTFVMYK